MQITFDKKTGEWSWHLFKWYDKVLYVLGVFFLTMHIVLSVIIIFDGFLEILLK